MLTQLLRGIFRRGRMEDELDEELRSSFEMLVERGIARGMSEPDARRAARLDFDGFDQVKEKVRDGFASAPFHALSQDVRYAWRGLRRRPSFTLLAAIILALGIGVNTAIFSVFYGVLLRPLPYDHPEKLALIWTSFRGTGTARAPVSGAILGEVEHRNRALAGVAGIWTITRTFTGDEPELVKAARVTPNFFDLLGVHAAAGRTFSPEDGGTPAILLANGVFERRFGGAHNVIGQRVPMDRANTVVGVMPRGFELHFAPDANVPADVQVFDTFGNGIYRGTKEYYIRLVARVRDGVSMAEAQRDLDRVASEIRGAYTEYANEDLRFTVSPMQADAVREVKPALTALFAGAMFVLLICCVNIGSLLLTRASDRKKEIAIRLSLGASRGRITRQLLIEGGLLCLLGGVAGAAAGWAGFRGLLAIRPERLAELADNGLSWPVLAFACVCSLGAALVFGIVPALESFRIDLMAALRASGRGWMGRLQRRAGAALIVGEITLGFVLVTGAVLSARSLSKVEQIRPGFEPHQLLVFQVSNGVPGNNVALWEGQLAAMAGVEAVGATTHLPLDTDIPNWYSPFQPEGMSASDAAMLISDLRGITPGYLRAMGARLLEGRYFEDSDRADAPPVVIIDESIAKQVWPGQSAIGRRIAAEHLTQNGFQPQMSTVVGVVEHLHNHSLTKEVRGQIYMPFVQSPRFPLTFALRTRVPPMTLVPAIRKMLHDGNKNSAMAKVHVMTEYVEREVSPVSFTAVLAAIFGVLALLLAATGIYGVINYQVSRRRPEMGIRMALGADAGAIRRLVLREGFALSAAGVVLGAACTFFAARALGTLLYEVRPYDPLSYIAALVLLPGAAMLGCWRPAWRASSANVAEVIREE